MTTNVSCFRAAVLQMIVADTGNNRLQLFHVDCMPGMMHEMRAGDVGRYMDTNTTANRQQDGWSARPSIPDDGGAVWQPRPVGWWTL